jgi:hypothetical protein
MDSNRQNGTREHGEIRYIPLSEWDLAAQGFSADPSHDKTRRQYIDMAVRGYTDVEEAELRFPKTPVTLESTGDGTALTFEPADFRPGRLLARSARTASLGMRSGTRLTRSYETPAFTLLMFDEHDYFSACALISVVKESLNATVCGVPASLLILRAASGRMRSHISWCTSKMMYSLQGWSSGVEADYAGRMMREYAAEIGMQLPPELGSG